MRIWMASIPVPSALFYLAEDPSVTLRACAPSEFKINPSHEVETRPLFRGVSPALFDRLNLKFSISFQVRRLWLTNDLATAYMIDLASNAIWSGTLWIQSTNGNVASSVLRHSNGLAVIQDATSSQTGCTTFHSFTILSPQLVT